MHTVLGYYNSCGLGLCCRSSKTEFLTTPRDANGINAMCMDFSRKFYTHTVEFGRIMYLGWQYRAASMAER